jgi:hypothetical protein
MDGEAAALVNHQAVDCQEAETARRMGTPIQRLGSTNEKAGGLCSVGWDRKFLTIVTRPKGDAGPPHHGGPEPLHHGRQTRKIGDGERRHDGNEGGEDAREGHDAERRIRTAKCLKYGIHGRQTGICGRRAERTGDEAAAGSACAPPANLSPRIPNRNDRRLDGSFCEMDGPYRASAVHFESRPLPHIHPGWPGHAGGSSINWSVRVWAKTSAYRAVKERLTDAEKAAATHDAGPVASARRRVKPTG